MRFPTVRVRIFHIGVGVCVACLGWMGNAKASDCGISNRIQTPALFLCISVHVNHYYVKTSVGEYRNNSRGYPW